MKCKDCKWWSDDEQCRRLPPCMALQQVAPDSDITNCDQGVWPFTHKSDWCGEFEANEEAIQEAMRLQEVHEAFLRL